jgi:hypothetical protein
LHFIFILLLENRLSGQKNSESEGFTDLINKVNEKRAVSKVKLETAEGTK